MVVSGRQAVHRRPDGPSGPRCCKWTSPSYGCRGAWSTIDCGRASLVVEVDVNDISDRVRAMYDEAAPSYESEPAHGIAPGEHASWIADLGDALPSGIGLVAADVGSGTGVFSRFLVASGYAVVGFEPSALMRAQAESRQTAGVEYVDGDAISVAEHRVAWNLIAARQSVCHFQDPLKVFKCWKESLAAGGRVLIVAGLWSRASWDDERVVDALPLSCVHTRATLTYLLRCAGFKSVTHQWLSAVNRHHRVGDGEVDSRYVAVAEP